MNRIAFLLDDEFEQRAGEHSVEFEEILRTSAVGDAVTEMRQFLADHCSDETALKIRQTLWQSVHEEYSRYSMLAEQRTGRPTADELLAVAEIDSGVILRQLAEIVALFENRELSPSEASDFGALGVACKLADDLRDWWRDECNGGANILSACLREQPNELRRAIESVEAGERLNEKRWLMLCPQSFMRFADIYAARYVQIQSTKLRLAVDLMMETGRLGHQSGEPELSAARIRNGTDA